MYYIISIFREYQTANMEFLEVFGGWEWTCSGGVGSLDICGGYHSGYHRCHGGKLLYQVEEEGRTINTRCSQHKMI